MTSTQHLINKIDQFAITGKEAKVWKLTSGDVVINKSLWKKIKKSYKEDKYDM